MRIIRECKTSDAESIYLLNKYEMGYNFSLEDTVNNLKVLLESTTDKILILEIDNKVVGYVHGCNYRCIYAPAMKNILGIAVNSDYKRRGVGIALMKAVKDWAKSENIFIIRLVSGDERKGVHEFYKKCGYEENKKQLNLKKILNNT